MQHCHYRVFSLFTSVLLRVSFIFVFMFCLLNWTCGQLILSEHYDLCLDRRWRTFTRKGYNCFAHLPEFLKTIYTANRQLQDMSKGLNARGRLSDEIFFTQIYLVFISNATHKNKFKKKIFCYWLVLQTFGKCAQPGDL